MTVLNEDQATVAEVTREPDNNITVSVKVHDGFSSPLITFRGSDPAQIKQDIVAVFGNLNVESVDDATVFELLTEAHAGARQIYQLHDILGATVDAKKPSQFASNSGGGNWPKKAAAGSTGAASGTDEAKAAEPDPNAEIGALIARATTVKELQTVWIQHKTKNVSEHQGWPTPELMELANAKGKEL